MFLIKRLEDCLKVEEYPSPKSTARYRKVFYSIALELDRSICLPRADTRRVDKCRLQSGRPGTSLKEYPEHKDLSVDTSELSLEKILTIPEVLFSKQIYNYYWFPTLLQGSFKVVS